MKTLLRETIEKGFVSFDAKLNEKLTLVMGGGGALVCVYNFPLATEDVDVFSVEKNLTLLDPLIKEVASELKLPPDWLNAYFSTFTGVLPQDYAKRLKKFFTGKHLAVFALGPEDLFIMKCFAGRDKDIPHAKVLRKQKGFDLNVVEDRFDELIAKKYPKALEARDFFDDVNEEYT